MYIITREKKSTLRPTVPTNRIFGEDDKTPRIRVFSTLEGAFSGIDDGGASLKWSIQDSDIFYIYQFLPSSLEGILSPEFLQSEGRVPDAMVTGEYWILENLNTCHMEVRKVRVKMWEEREITYLPAPILSPNSILYENMGVVTWIDKLLLEEIA